MNQVYQTLNVHRVPCLIPWAALCAAVLLLTATVRAEDAATEPAGPKPESQASTAPETPALETKKEKLSYVLGLNAGKSYKANAIEVDPDLFRQGLKDALAGGQSRLTEEEIAFLYEEFQAEMKQKLEALRKTRQEEKALAEKARADHNKASGEAFLAENKTKDGVVTLESGLQYKVLKEGDGEKPKLDDTVYCHYRGTLIDGTEFDSSYKRGQPAALPIKKVIKGWAEALQLMPAGSKWQVFIPAQLAYGARGAGRSIPPHATLIFEVDLISVNDAPSDSPAATQQSEASSTESSPARQQPVDDTALARSVRDIKVSFKLDPRLTKSLYMGDRWVSPPTYTTTVPSGKSLTVEAKAEAVDAKGTPLAVTPGWVPSDPEMVVVSPGQGNAVKVTVQREGSSRLRVASGGVAKELAIKAMHVGESLQAEISQN